MKGIKIRYKGFEILHSHVFNNVFFQAWKGNRIIWNRKIKKDNRDIDWDNPLNKEEKEFLISGELF